jgi:pimeloyl-ACP methyl ester carboxylesterase
MIRVPSNWNGTLIRDLDGVDLMTTTIRTGGTDQLVHFLLERGYAFAGTERHPRRWVGGFDPNREIERIEMVHDVFLHKFDEPSRVIQFGCSGGGRVGAIIAEEYPDRVDGVLAVGNQPVAWWGNQALDFFFVLHSLLAPELQFLDLSMEGGTRPVFPSLAFAWRQVITEAQETPEGRARIALALTIGQMPAIGDPRFPEPDRNNVAELQLSMYQAVLEAAHRVGGLSRYMLESSPGFGARSYQVSWNDDVDYKEFFENGNKYNKRAVRQLYEEAGLELEADLEKINRTPRISADPEGLAYWSARGRIAVGNPKVPVLRWHDVGDNLQPVSNVQGYMDLVRTNGKEDMVRLIYSKGPTHCRFTVAELFTAIKTLEHRLDTGSWGPTDPEHLNELGRSIEPGNVTRFIPTSDDRYSVGKYNRTWVPDWAKRN